MGIILGQGYVGGFFKESFPTWDGTSRSGGKGKIKFDWLDESTWKNLPSRTNCLITFNMSEGDEYLFCKFKEFCFNRFNKIIALGSTSAFVNGNSPEKPLSESSTLNIDNIRVYRENLFQSDGAMVLRLTGIYGPNRSPVTWLKKQLVSAKKKHVNLIHVHDIIWIMAWFFRNFEQGKSYILSDGEEHRWDDIIKWGKENGQLESSFKLVKESSKRPVKYISNKSLKNTLPQDFTFKKMNKELLKTLT